MLDKYKIQIKDKVCKLICWKNSLILTLNVHKGIKFFFFAQIKIAKKLQLFAIKNNVNAIKIIKNARYRYMNHQLNFFKERFIVMNHLKN